MMIARRIQRRVIMVHPSQQRPNFSARRPLWSVTYGRGAKARTFGIRPYLAVPALGAFALLMTAYVGATAYLVYRDDLLGAAVSRQVSMQYAYEERIAALRSELDRLASRHVVQTESVEQQVSTLLEQQAVIERRQSALDGIVERARAAGVDVATTSTQLDAEPAAAFEARPADSSGGPAEPLSFASRGPAAEDPIAGVLLRSSDPEKPAARDHNIRPILANLRSSLDGTETELAKTLDVLSNAAQDEAARLSAALAPIGVGVGSSGEAAEEPEGGPFIPATGMHFVESAALLDRTLEDIAALRAAAAIMPVGLPVKSNHLSSRFGYRLDPFLKRPAFHAGLDFAAQTGSTVYAAAAGTVVSAGWNGGYGKMVEVRHADGMSTRYGHLSKILVVPGVKVATGTPIGRVGSTGRSTGPHLHYETRRDGEAVNPAPYVAAGKALRVRS